VARTVTNEEAKKARELAKTWLDEPSKFGDIGPDVIADSLAQRLIRALDALEAERNKPRPRPTFDGR
jgi:hypothetical protein